jgi:hypothetical protein
VSQFRTWFDRVSGVFAIVFGIAFIAPGAFILGSHLFFYTVGLKPDWLPKLFGVMALAGVIQIWGGVNALRWAGRWE